MTSARRTRPCLVVVALVCSTTVASETAVTTNSEVIVYTALRPAEWDLYLFEGPESEPKRLTHHPALDYNPAVSPDGRWLVFCSERRGNPDLFIIDLKQPGEPRLLIGSEASEDAPDFSPDGRRLALVSSRDGNADVFVLPFDVQQGTVDGDEMENLTKHKRGDFNPAFSPDGKRIAFSSDRDGYKASEIYVMNVDGSDPKRLTEAEGWDGSPAWSADGESLWFYSARDGNNRIYRCAADGGTLLPITQKNLDAVSPAVMRGGRVAYTVHKDGRWQIESAAADGSATRRESSGDQSYWAPTFDRQGRMICHGETPSDAPKFKSGTPGPFQIGGLLSVQLPDRTLQLAAIRGYFPTLGPTGRNVATDEGFDRVVISGLDGSGLREVYRPKDGRTWRPSWSKDGRWLASTVGPTFAKPKATANIWRFRPDGSEAKNLTANSAANDAFPDFSPDGRRIVFRSGRDGNHEIYLMQADGSGVRRLTDNAATDTMPAFAPDGKHVAFTSTRDNGDYEIYLLAVSDDGKPGKLRRLTECPGRDTHPKFSPDGKWLLFASERGGMNDEAPLIPVFNPQPYGEIYAKRLDDGHVVRLTHNKWEDGTPTWGKLLKAK